MICVLVSSSIRARASASSAHCRSYSTLFIGFLSISPLVCAPLLPSYRLPSHIVAPLPLADLLLEAAAQHAHDLTPSQEICKNSVVTELKYKDKSFEDHSSIVRDLFIVKTTRADARCPCTGKCSRVTFASFEAKNEPNFQDVEEGGTAYLGVAIAAPTSRNHQISGTFGAETYSNSVSHYN
jgi:hypothetical protein